MACWCIIIQEIFFNHLAQVRIDESSLIRGELFCNQNTELGGVVHGAVYTKQFVLNRSGSVYINYLDNARISKRALDFKLAGIAFEQRKQSKAKWLY
jgi:hypothetical protein